MEHKSVSIPIIAKSGQHWKPACPLSPFPLAEAATRFRIGEDAEDVRKLPVVGWIGTESTWKFVEPLLPILEQAAPLTPFRLSIVGSGRTSVTVCGVDVELLPWSLDREVLDFQTLDAGLYPMSGDRWTAGKSGLKLIQYFAAGA